MLGGSLHLQSADRYKVHLSACCKGNRCSSSYRSLCLPKDLDSVHSRPALEAPSHIGSGVAPDSPLSFHHQVPSSLPLAATSLADLKSNNNDDDDDIAFPPCIVYLQNCSRLRKLPHLQKCIGEYQMFPDSCPSTEACSECT